MPPRILFIDAYDSFSNSIIALLRSELGVVVESIKIDDPRFVLNDKAFFKYLDAFAAVVAGPGPGHPAKSEDIGLIGRLWDLPDEHVLPVLGICLGFQSLGLAFGGNVGRLREPRHGIMAIISHAGKDVFSGAGKVVATQYHSLHVQLEGGEGEAWEPRALWIPSAECPDLLPLAWDLMNVMNGPVLMAVRHCNKPFWGVQYHPESICTNSEGQRLIRKWWEESIAWRACSKRAPMKYEECEQVKTKRKSHEAAERLANLPGRSVNWTVLDTGSIPSVEGIVELLRRDEASLEPLLLESGTRNGKPVNPETGRFSVVGLHDSLSMHIRYSTHSNLLEILHDGEIVLQEKKDIAGVFVHLEDHVQSQKAANGPQDSPFWGGLLGFISYEAGLESIAVPPNKVNPDRPDLWFVFVERSIVVDHVKGVIYIQSIRLEDEEWIERTKLEVQTLVKPAVVRQHHTHASLLGGPEQQEYCQKVRECQKQLRAGESYELCLTDQSTIQTQADPWDLYRQLQDRNPAPFSAYLRLQSSQGSQGISVAGSSPERFLSWSREGRCQFRPIKGTVKKAPGVTRAKAEDILGSAKERAENLMIVDLIRHDLAGVLGVSDVRVPKLMTVEEYETVFQLVSVVEGDLEPSASGIAALAASLPPGSMTGAPKKRSCELLKEIEDGQPRGLYSGVIGYLDVGGAGDFSVVIRTAFKWDDEGDRWRIGAGGAITALSDPEAEWEEMMAKRESVLNSLS